MKTKRILTLLIAMFIGVLVNAQTEKNGPSGVIGQPGVEDIKIMILKYGSDMADLFGFLNSEQITDQRVVADRCAKNPDQSQACSNLRKRGAKPFPHFPKYPDMRVPDKKKQ